MGLHTKCAVIGSIGTVALGTLAYFMHKHLKNKKEIKDEIMEVIFTHDKTEGERTRNVSYLDVSQLNFQPKNLEKIEEYINSATKTIDAAVYLFNVTKLGEAMIRAYKRGVAVRIVGCTSMQGATGTQFATLHAAGIPVLFKNTTMCMHHKFCLIDTRSQTEKETKDGQKRINDQNDAKRKAKKKAKIERELASDDEESEKEDKDSEKPRKKNCYIPKNGICITGSCNWTMQGFSSNWENIIVTNNHIIVSRFRQEFDRIWSDFISAQKVREPVIRNDLAGWHE